MIMFNGPFLFSLDPQIFWSRLEMPLQVTTQEHSLPFTSKGSVPCWLGPHSLDYLVKHLYSFLGEALYPTTNCLPCIVSTETCILPTCCSLMHLGAEGLGNFLWWLLSCFASCHCYFSCFLQRFMMGGLLTGHTYPCGHRNVFQGARIAIRASSSRFSASTCSFF